MRQTLKKKKKKKKLVPAEPPPRQPVRAPSLIPDEPQPQVIDPPRSASTPVEPALRPALASPSRPRRVIRLPVRFRD